MSEGDTVGRPENDELRQSLGAALWQWGRHRELPESADPIFEAAEMVYAALMGDSTDLVSVIRAGVESGTIEGEVVETLKNPYNFRVPVSSPGIYIVIGPVSDGGSET